jgi:hypothetical protein
MNIKEIGWGRGVEWIDLAQDRSQWRPVVKTVLDYRKPLKTSNLLRSRGTTFSMQDDRVRFPAATAV